LGLFSDVTTVVISYLNEGSKKMKINGRKSQQVGPMGPLQPPVQAGEIGEAASPESNDSVDLSSTRELNQLNRAVQSMPSVRTKKVEGLRDAIDEGEYYVESDKLARKVVHDVLTEALINEKKD
jgi:negative regulator of flagellin synthesis FlgM